MLRPATILSVFIFAAFALILVATLSTPIIKGIPLGSVDDVTFGVLGYCSADKCSGFEIGYSNEFLDASDSKFDLPANVRNSLTTILIVHPVAAFLALVLFIMAAASHFHSPGNSVRYLLGVFIFSILTFLVCLLAFLVDILLFVPHLGWASYLVVAATVMVGLSSLFICAMRRTLISRKDRKNRIAENAEMSGENYYNREAQKSAIASSRQPTMPSVSGANGDALPTFASFEDEKRNDENIPLTQRSPSERSAQLARVGTGSPVHALGEPVRSNSVPLGSDQYGNPMGPSPGDYAALRGGRSNDALDGARRGGMAGPGYRGVRGGYGGGYGPGPGPSPGRGGYGSQGRGSYGPRGGPYGAPRGPGSMRGGGYQNYGGSYDRRPSPANAYGGYGQGSSDSYTAANAAPGGYGAYGSPYPRAESPPDMTSTVSSQPGQAIEMEGTTMATAISGPTTNYTAVRDSDSDVAGMVGLQQGYGANRQPTDSYMSEGSKYSNDESHGQYVPPRAGWNQQGRHSPSVPSPLAIGRATPGAERNPPEKTTAYYEDVDARYANDSRARSPQWGGFPGGRPSPQNSNPSLRGQGGLSPPPQGRGYNAF